MAGDLAAALLQGNVPGLAADPMMAQVIPNLTLAQAMMQEGMSGAPAYPMQAIGRLAQTLAGVKMMSDAQGQLSGMYGGAVRAMSKVFPEGTLIGDMLRSDHPYVQIQGLQAANKVAVINSEKTPLGPEQRLVYPSTQGGPGLTAGTGSPALAGAAEGAKAAAKAPYEAGGEMTRETPRGRETFPITSATRAAMQPDLGPVNPSRVQGQPQNLTGPIIPPGGARGQQPPAPAVPPRPRTPNAEPAAADFDQRFNAAYGGQPVQTPEFKAREEQYGAAGKALGGVIAEHIEAGGKGARDRLNALDTIESAMRTNEGRGIVTGPHAENILKLRETLDGMGIDTSWIKEGMAQSEMIQKMNAQLASASAKAMTGRPTQFEFRAWQQNNPGLLTSREGSLALLDVLRQQAHQDIELGKLAQNKKNWENWPEVVDQFYKTHDLTNPLTGRSMREDIAASRGAGARPAGVGGGATMPVVPPGGAQAGARAPVRVSTPQEARRLPSGTPIILPDGRSGVVP